MIISLSSLFSIVLHSLLLLYRNGYKVKHTIIRTKTQNIIKRFETLNHLSHKPNEIKRKKEKEDPFGPHFVGDREEDKWLWRRSKSRRWRWLDSLSSVKDLRGSLFSIGSLSLSLSLSLCLSFWVSTCVHLGFSWPRVVKGHHTLGPWRHDSWVIVYLEWGVCVCESLFFFYFIFRSRNQLLVLY